MPTLTPNLGLYKPLVNNATDADLWGGYLNDDMDILDAAIPAILPTGIIFPYGGLTEPSGFLFCYGQSLLTATYPDLFAVFVYTYGGAGASFNLPDLRGRAVAGRDDMGGVSADRLTGLPGGVNGDTLGGSGGEQSHQLTIAELASHQHLAATGQFYLSVVGASSIVASGSGGGVTTNSGTDATGGNAAHNNVQPTFILNYIVKT